MLRIALLSTFDTKESHGMVEKARRALAAAESSGKLQKLASSAERRLTRIDRAIPKPFRQNWRSSRTLGAGGLIILSIGLPIAIEDARASVLSAVSLAALVAGVALIAGLNLSRISFQGLELSRPTLETELAAGSSALGAWIDDWLTLHLITLWMDRLAESVPVGPPTAEPIVSESSGREKSASAGVRVLQTPDEATPTDDLYRAVQEQSSSTADPNDL
jgi:hypothetical protein